jgi:hypothetical protein
MGNLVKDLTEGFVTAWDGFWTAWMAELFWIGLCLPVVTIPAAFAGLYYTMFQLANGESLEWRTFFEGIKLYIWPALRWTGINLLVIAVLGSYTLYLTTSVNISGQDWVQAASGIPFGLLVIWVAVNAFTFPFMLAQEKPSYRMALRNSLTLYLKWPVYAIVFILVNGIVIALSVWLVVPWLIFTTSFTALMACVCVKNKVWPGNGIRPEMRP